MGWAPSDISVNGKRSPVVDVSNSTVGDRDNFTNLKGSDGPRVWMSFVDRRVIRSCRRGGRVDFSGLLSTPTLY
jgi:hypothetical protein